MKRFAIVATIVIGLTMIGAPTFAFASGSVAASLPDIEDEVMCPICGTILEASNAPQAERQREFIRTRIESGEDKEQIKAALVEEYGPEVLAVPASSGFDLLAWLVPIVGLLAAVAVLTLAMLKIRRTGAPQTAEISARDLDRVNRDLADTEDP